MIEDDAAGAELAYGIHVMADVKDRSALRACGVTHFAEALLLKLHISDGKHLVHYHYLAVKVRGDGKRKLDVHTARITLDRSVDEFFHLREFNDLIEFPVYLGLCHAEDSTVHINVLAPRQLGMKAGAHLKH